MKPVRKSLLIWLLLAILSAATPITLAQARTPVFIKENTKPPSVVVPTEEAKPTPNPEATNTPKPASTDTDTQKPNPEVTEPKKSEEAAELPPSPEEIARQQKLMEADKLYLEGEITTAQQLYREVKEPFAQTPDTEIIREAVVDPAQLSPAGKVYWREAEAGIASKLQTRTLVPLQLLVEKYPEFIPGQLRYAEVLKQYGDSKKAIEVLERAATMYPNQPELVKARITALADAKKWMEASLAARQFAVLNPSDPQVPEFNKLADENLKQFKSHIKGEIRGNALANVLTGTLGYAVTGNIFGPFSALNSTILLLKGEESAGDSAAKQVKNKSELLQDEAVLGYVKEIGQKLAKTTGRNDFKYEFFVIKEKDLNAFALPGGKVFVNAGAIAKTNSEAELAGLIAHELSHAVLSHGFQLTTQGNLISNVTRYLPFGGTVGKLVTLKYNRDMERQADTLGTRLIVANGYAADGLRNLMVILEKEQKDKNAPPSWLSSHPGGKERVQYLEEMISRDRYNRYAYEGVARHTEIKQRVKQLLQDKKEDEDKNSSEKHR